MAFLAPALPFILGAAAVGTATSSIISTVQQRRSAKKMRVRQEEALGKQEGIQQKQERAASAEKKKLQAEQSDEIRRTRTRGRRSLLAGDEKGVGLGGKRDTTG